jgi:hypothetical protein
MSTQYTGDLIDELRTVLTGTVVGPQDTDWDAERSAWHLLVSQQPAAVVHVASVEDVQSAIRIARRAGVKVTAQPVGHGATGTANGRVILLRTGALTTVERTGEVVRVGAGVRWRDLNAALNGTGLTSLPGSNGDTSVVGYTIGGGLSWFGRKYGMAANHVRAIELVDAEGNHLRVTKDAFPDLFWAVRGGGGEFGIVTALELDLQPAGQLYGGRMMWFAEHSRQLLRAFADVTETAPDELTLWAWLINMPDLPFVPEPLRGHWMVAIDSTYLGDGETAEKLLAPIRAVATPVVDGLGEVPIADIGLISQEPEEPMPGLGRVRLLTEFRAETVDALLELVLDGETPLAMVEVRHLGGAFTRSHPGDGAAGTIDASYLLLLAGIVMAPEQLGPIEASFDSVYAGLSRWVADHVPPNMSHGELPVERLFPKDVLDRLREIKHRVDPLDLIRGNHPLQA